MILCSKCFKVYNPLKKKSCPGCGDPSPDIPDTGEGEKFIEEQMPLILSERKRLGLDVLAGKPQALIINTQNEYFTPTVDDYLLRTGMTLAGIFGDIASSTAVLRHEGSPDIIVKTRRKGDNPFRSYNEHLKSMNMPDTRLETTVFETPDIDEYVKIQKSRGIDFMTSSVQDLKNCRYIQTSPSPFTGNSMGFIQWKDSEKNYESLDAMPLELKLSKVDRPYLSNIGNIDHTATRVGAQERNSSILECMILTGYTFDFAIYVESLNSITSVTRMKNTDFAMVFTSGINPYISDAVSGPTEKFVNNYGPRIHHIAFQTENIEETFDNLRSDGMGFLLELVGSPEDGLKQTFSKASRYTMLVNEYLQRYEGFDGFFAKSNVTELTRATGKQ
jgi:hypothetical protein